MKLHLLTLRMRLFALLISAGALALSAGCTTTPVPSTNYKTTHRLVFPQTATAVTIDGLATEAAWANGFKYVMEDGGAFPAATLRGVADAGAIYLYVEVEDTNFNDNDVVVIGLNPDNAATNYRRIHVFPCKPTGACPANGNNVAASIQYWTGSNSGGGYTWTSQPVAGTGIVAKSATATAGALKKWSVELKIPRGAPFNFVDTNFFGLFVDVARTDPTAGIDGEATQYTWPPAQFIGGATENDILSQLEAGTLSPGAWGNATLSKVFGNGVSISANEIRTNHPSDPGKIRINDPNIFYATAANNSSSGGTLVAAKGVSATFKIANNGLPTLGSFANVLVGGNPAGPADIAATVAHTFSTGVWSLTPPQKTDYTSHPNQCIRVELTSTDPTTVFTNASAMRNMQFVTTSSPFRERAALTTKGFEPRPEQRTVAYTLRESFVNFDPKLTWTTEIGNATRVRERLYRAELAPGSDRQLEISVTPPNLRIPSEAVQIPPGTGGPRPVVKMDVRPDQILTFISSGQIIVDGIPITAAGTAATERGSEKSGLGPDAGRSGALVGSFDGFRTTFHLGTAASIKVPQGANVLELKIQDDPKRYESHKGEGFALQVVRTSVEPWMLAANPGLSRQVEGHDVHVTLGANLPTWLMRGERDTGRFVTIDKKSYRVFEPVGSFGYIVKRIN